jgi:hypothetical protein
MATSFPEFALEQGFARTLALLAISATVYLVLLAAVSLLWRCFSKTPVLGAVLVSTAAVLVVAVLGITIFEASALWFAPHGPGTERQGADYEDFFAAARALFFGLYASLVLLAVGGGFVIARRRTDRAAVAAIGSGVAVIVYLVLTLPFVEFLNACYVGRSFLNDDVRC